MVQYCESIRDDSTQVICLLCRIELRAKDASQDARPCPKDYWASNHFRFKHWEYYFSMRPQEASQSLRHRRGVTLILPENLINPVPGSGFSNETWIDLTHVSNDTPIATDQGIIRSLNIVSSRRYIGLRGPVLIQRFVVVRQDLDQCLCLGIHTYSRRGCGDQPDQELFGILHSSEEPPPPMANETRMTLAPIRMKSDHPSTALPRTARIHHGRAYDISHHVLGPNMSPANYQPYPEYDA
ncbi:hypothetical protein F4814DRAFT_286837 [Daldinia grandis]|nr:hypothetical protein F4814DRAFT_286837 [Daldinia grandis]